MSKKDVTVSYRTCPSGHKLTVDKFHSTVYLTKEEIDDAIVFDCPGGKRGHTFTLRKAEVSGMFNIEEVEKIRQAGLAHRERYS